jgi:hypothetical protein
MVRRERKRDVLHGAIGSEYLEAMMREGWRPVALEWERQAEGKAAEPPAREEVPFGLRVSGDCLHLEEDAGEMAVLSSMMELMIQDISLTGVAEELNREGLLTRDGTPWNAAAVFRLLPRVVDVAPRIFTDAQWRERRKRLARVAWNS